MTTKSEGLLILQACVTDAPLPSLFRPSSVPPFPRSAFQRIQYILHLDIWAAGAVSFCLFYIRQAISSVSAPSRRASIASSKLSSSSSSLRFLRAIAGITMPSGPIALCRECAWASFSAAFAWLSSSRNSRCNSNRCSSSCAMRWVQTWATCLIPKQICGAIYGRPLH